MLAKQEVLNAFEQLPDNVPYDKLISIIDELQFVENTKQGLKDVEAGKTYAMEDVFAELSMQ